MAQSEANNKIYIGPNSDHGVMAAIWVDLPAQLLRNVRISSASKGWVGAWSLCFLRNPVADWVELLVVAVALVSVNFTLFSRLPKPKSRLEPIVLASRGRRAVEGYHPPIGWRLL